MSEPTMLERVPCCNYCEPVEPLILTLEFAYHEYICMNCGSLFEFLGIRRELPTPELLAKYEANKLAYQVDRERRAKEVREAEKSKRLEREARRAARQ